jgi:hypothetical protein
MDVNDIIAYEQGDLDPQKTIEMFAEGIKSGDVWKLQGSYGRTASSIIASGVISEAGVIDQDRLNELMGGA